MGYAVEIDNLTKKFGDFVAVDEISLTVESGEIFGFLGANGAGKTTAIRMLCGLLLPTSGKGIVNGFDIYKESEKIKKSIGYMSQKFSLYKISPDGRIYGSMVRCIRYHPGICERGSMNCRRAWSCQNLSIVWQGLFPWVGGNVWRWRLHCCMLPKCSFWMSRPAGLIRSFAGVSGIYYTVWQSKERLCLSPHIIWTRRNSASGFLLCTGVKS